MAWQTRRPSSSIEIALGQSLRPLLRSRTSASIPSMPSRLAAVRPVGPAPAMMTEKYGGDDTVSSMYGPVGIPMYPSCGCDSLAMVVCIGMVQMHVTVPHQQQDPALSRLREAKDLAADHDRPFASLRVTQGDCSTCQGLFFKIEPCLNILYVGRRMKGEYARDSPSLRGNISVGRGRWGWEGRALMVARSFPPNGRRPMQSCCRWVCEQMHQQRVIPWAVLNDNRVST